MVAPKNANEKAVVDFFETLSTGDLVALAGRLHEDASWEPMVKDIPGAGRHAPRDRIINEFLAPIRGAFREGDPKVHVDVLMSDGDRVVAETHATGQKADGKPYNNRYAWSFELRDGKILNIREYMDSLYVARFFDMIPAGPAA
ncbi:MAG: nuclear transport factor 2 family protein [Caulobacteraceae bacterium]